LRNLIVIISILSITLGVYSCPKSSPISELGTRFINDNLTSRNIKSDYVLVLTPSECASCIQKDLELLIILEKAKNINDFTVVAPRSMNEVFTSKFNNINFISISNTELQRYGHIGHLGTIYKITNTPEEIILPLEPHSSNIELISSFCK
jgi:hypothetical protein